MSSSKENIKNEKWIAWLLIGLGFLAVASGIGITINKKNYVPLTAVITKIESEYDAVEDRFINTVYVNYKIDGTEYKNINLGFYRDGLEQGQKIEIYYNPSDPSKIEGASNGVAIYLILIGAFIGVFGIYLKIRHKG